MSAVIGSKFEKIVLLRALPSVVEAEYTKLPHIGKVEAKGVMLNL